MIAKKIKNTTIDIEKIRNDFPILQREVRPGVPLVYLDSTSTSQKPKQVIRSLEAFYANSNSNIHRGVHALAEEATGLFEGARQRIAEFIGSASSRQVIFVRNTTEAINLVAMTWGRRNIHAGELIIVTEMEHHSNLVPWQMLAKETGAQLVPIFVTDDGLLDLENYQLLLNQNPKMVAFTHMSNVLGTINPAKEMIKMAHEHGAITLLDGAQSVPHFKVDVQSLDVDFLTFSGHKMLGPTGIGILYGKKNLLEEMPPYLGGGDMIKRVYINSFVVNEIPYKFEAGTPSIAEAIGFGEAVTYLSHIGMDRIAEHEHNLVEYAYERLSDIPDLRLLGPNSGQRGGVISFTMMDVHPHDISQVLDNYGIAIRAGHHCAMPLHDRYNIPASARASFYLYNTSSEVDKFVKGIYRVKDLFGA